MKRLFATFAAIVVLALAAYGIKLYIRYTWPGPVASMQDLPPVDRTTWPKSPVPWSNVVEQVTVATPAGLKPATITYAVNSIGMKLVRIEPGTFLMGTPPRNDRLSPTARARPHQVTLTRPYYLGAFEVSNREFELFQPDHIRRRPRYQRGEFAEDHPAQPVTWREAQEFCRWLSAREGRLYRLPTEAEWEYACKAGTTNRLYWGDDFWNRNLANTKGWKSVEESWADDGHKFTAPVGCYPANPWGLFDMVGNVREWVQDWHGPFPAEPQVDPQGPHLPDRYRVMKGSGWMTPSRHLSCSNRDGNNPADLHDPNGFRILCEIEEASPPPRP